MRPFRCGGGGVVKFRPDIEGLRGVAVLLVVLAHARVPGLAGGFVGVDVFFVISGFLITGLLAEEVARSGRVDYWAFYARRARRLAPAMLLMLAMVSALCLGLLPGDTLQLQLESGRWAALWLSNVYFAFAQFDYFGNAAQDSLFLHTWSLGVEEQFYLIWPLIVVLAWRGGGGRYAWLVGLIVISLLSSLLLMPIDATSVYYLMPTRLWQLGLGGLVYRFYGRNDGPVVANERAGAAWAGAGLLAVSLLVIDGNVSYPGLWALLPALGAAALLISGSGNGGGVISRVLSSQWLRLPGRISYSWYLWHWPILMLGPALGWWPLGGLESLALILVSFLVGWVSFAWVEQPARRSTSGTPRSVVVLSLLISLILAALLHLASSVTGLRNTGPQSFEQRVLALVTIPSVYFDDRCDQWYSSAEVVPCEVDAGDGDGGVMVLIGDSIGTHWLPAIEHAAQVRRMRLIVLTKSSCAIVDEPFVYSRIHRRFTECEQWRDAAIAHVRAIKPDLVIIGSASTYGFTTEQWIQGSRRVIERLSEGLRPVAVLAPSPLLDFHGPGCVIAEGRESPAGVEVVSPACAASLASVEDSAVIAALGEAVESVPEAHLVYLNDLVCDNGACRAVRDGNLVFRDQQHLNASFAQSLGDAVDRRLPPALPVNR